MNPTPSLWQRLQFRVAASRFFTFSLLMHTIIVLLGGGVVLFKSIVPLPDFIGGSEGTLIRPDEAPPDPLDPLALTASTFQPAKPPVADASAGLATSSAASSPNFRVANVLAQLNPSVAKQPALPTLAAMTPTRAANVPGSMEQRFGEAARRKGREGTGGKPKSEKAAIAGLRWLREHQNADGSWGEEARAAMTGLATLCFLGHGETPELPEFGPTVKGAVDWLLKTGAEGKGKFAEPSQPGVYEHAIATYAACEYYSMTKDERFAELVRQAATIIVDGQDANGGWQYLYAKGPESDTSVSGWQIQALKAAHLTGLGIPGVDEALDKAMLNLKRMQAEDGSFGYRKAGDHDYTLTGVGVLCTYFWKQDKDRSVKNGIESLLRMTEKYPVKYKGESANLYAWYYHTQACLMFGGGAWTKWNRLFQDEIANAQSADGSWPRTGGKGPRENDANLTSQTYRTTLCILMLEVFYRYMPITK